MSVNSTTDPYGAVGRELPIETGEFVFLTGPSGAGKSTLLKLLFREQVPSSGDIQRGGASPRHHVREGDPFLRRKLGVVFQDFKLIHSLTSSRTWPSS